MEARRSRGRLVAALFGESLREIAVLIAVFAPLDFYVQGIVLTGHFVLLIIVSVVVLLGLGIILEVWWR